MKHCKHVPCHGSVVTIAVGSQDDAKPRLAYRVEGGGISDLQGSIPQNYQINKLLGNVFVNSHPKLQKDFESKIP